MQAAFTGDTHSRDLIDRFHAHAKREIELFRGREIKVFKIDQSSDHPYLRPGADPGEGFHNTNLQLFSTDDPLPSTVPANRGFVINFKAAIASDLARHFKDTLPDTAASDIMGMYAPEMLPVLSGLAKGYAVCDHWFASAPTQVRRSWILTTKRHSHSPGR